MISQTLQKVDHAALKANQLFIISLNILAFILNHADGWRHLSHW